MPEVYRNTCDCGGPLYVVGFSPVGCRLPVERDGFFLGDGPCSTEDEVIECADCGKTGPLQLLDTDEEEVAHA